MRLHRFYVAQPLGEEVVILDVSIIKQWVKVFRYTQGDFVILFNGDGNDYRYSLASIAPKKCTLASVRSDSSYIPKKKTYLYLSLIKKDNFELTVEKATELGITDIVPFISEHTEKRNLDRIRLQRIIKEATEQCGRGDILTIHPIVPFKDIEESLLTYSIRHDRVYTFTLLGEPIRKILRELPRDEYTPKNAAFIVGPEGGWGDKEEVFIKEQSFIRVSLGDTVLRAETAGIVCSFLSSVI